MKQPNSDTAQSILLRLVELSESQESLRAKLLLVRGILEELYKELTVDAQVSLGGLFARMQYLHEQVSVSSYLAAQANLLRILGNNVAHEAAFEPNNAHLASALLVMRELLQCYFTDLDTSSLDTFLSAQDAKPFPERPHARRFDLLCVVRSWNIRKADEQITGIEIKALDENGVELSFLLRDGKDDRGGKKWSLLSRCLWEWATVNFLNVSLASGAPNQYIDNPGTLVVLEPDYLMDVSIIAECISHRNMHPELAILKRMISEGSSQSPVMGMAINNIFDDLMFDPNADYNQLFRDSLDRSPIPLVALGKEAALEIHSQIRDEHLPRLKSMAAFVHNLEMMLEPSFISPKYGLQGRLDLLYKKDNKHYIVELKSGSAPKNGAWPQHQAQVIGYNMMIRDCYGKDSQGSSSILYSRLAQKQMIHVTNTTEQEQVLLMCRNRILGIYRQLAENPKPFIDWLKNTDGSSLQEFSRQKLKTLQSLINALDPIEYEWYLEQIRLAIRETWYAKIGSSGSRSQAVFGYNALWQRSRAEKLQRYSVITNLKLEKIEKNLLSFRVQHTDRISVFREGDVVLAYRQDLPVHAQELIRAELICLLADSLQLKTRGVINPRLMQDKDQLWAIEQDLLESMLFAPLASVSGFLNTSPTKRRKLMGITAPEFDPVSFTSGDEIDELMAQIDAAKDYCVVQGPPGTGKTSGLITRYIKKLFESTQQTVLILSFTNRAVDEICFNLDRHNVPYIRTGRSQAIEEQLMSNMIRGKRFEEIDKILKQNRIWVATVQSCNSWIHDFIRLKHKIDTLIIDEASQIIEPAILGILALADRAVLIGDQNQLPPIVSQEQALYHFEAPELKELCFDSYNRSMMERLFILSERRGWNQARHMLRKHYRMHEAIASMIQHFYANSLQSTNPSQRQELPSNQDALLPNHRVLWIDCPVTLTAFYDQHQCEVIESLLERLILSGEVINLQTDVGIVAPFRAMIQALYRQLGGDYEELTIDTVERFQGSERKVIIYTLPLRNFSEIKNLEALSQDMKVDRKLNVALSRAKERLIILGNSKICSASPHYAFLIDKISSSHKVILSSQILNQI